MNTKTPTAEQQQSLEERKKNAKRELQRELMEALPNSALAEKKRLKRKKQFRLVYLFIGAIVLGYMMYWLVKPYQTSMPYGVCKVFIELYAPYPHTIYYSQVENFSDSVRIWFSKVDPFGEYRLEPMECFFKVPESGYGFELDRVTIGRREIDPDLVQRFNVSIPVIFAHPPDLTYPTALPDSLEGLKFDFDAYRKQIL